MNSETEIRLDERLDAIRTMIEPCDCVADIGTDHGFLGAKLLLDGTCGRVQFLDISDASLQKARRLCMRMDLGARAVFNVGDGAAALLEKADYVVIAGMGGQTIEGIIERGREKLGDSKLILQANVGMYELRKKLGSLGYRIDAETVVRAAKRHYVIIRARRGEARYTEEEMYIGPVLMHDTSDAMRTYAAFRVRVLKKACEGAKNSEPDKAEAYLREMRMWEAYCR